MNNIFEFIMLICFGLSWPISVIKSLRTKSTQGKSLLFIIAIIIGYLSGIAGKIANSQISYVLVIYCINLAMVTADLIIYFINKNRQTKV